MVNNQLEFFLDNYVNEIININLDDYKIFNYKSKELFIHHINFLKLFYNINITHNSITRTEQSEFRNNLLKKYNKCVVTSDNCKEQLEACHIIPFSEGGDYNINNGLILTRNLHSTFDKYLWTINPNTLIIETKDGNIGDICKYKNNKINININQELYKNLLYHYNKFITIKN
jgi:putative restriction endonuclease